MNKGFLNFIALFSFTIAAVSGVMAILTLGVGIQIYIPEIRLGAQEFRVNLVQIGFFAALVYAFAQTIQALTKPASPGFETLALVGSWIALGMFVLAGVLMVAQIGIDIGNVKDLMRTSYPFQLLLTLLFIALVDVTLLQWIKHRQIVQESHEVHDAHGHETTHREVVRDGRVTLPNSQYALIGHADRAVVVNIEASNRRLDMSFENGMPKALRLEPISTAHDMAHP